VRRVERIQHLEVFEGCRKECVQDSSLRLELRESSGGIGPSSNRRREAQEACAVECLAGVASLRAGGQVLWRNTWFICRNHQEGRTVGIL
jgi:hypothetical protein